MITDSTNNIIDSGNTEEIIENRHDSLVKNSVCKMRKTSSKNDLTDAATNKKMRPPPIPKNTDITYLEFFKHEIDIKKYRLPELKRVAKYNYLRVGGNKPVLLHRIISFFAINMYANHIQCVVRGHLVRRMIKLRGPAYANRSLCVNSSDFFTLEPLDEISKCEFFSYCDKEQHAGGNSDQDRSNFIYGCNINSFMNLLKRKGMGIMNPYNRNVLAPNIIKSAISLYRSMMLYMPNSIDPADVHDQETFWMSTIYRNCMNIERRVRQTVPLRIPQARRILPITIDTSGTVSLSAAQFQRGNRIPTPFFTEEINLLSFPSSLNLDSIDVSGEEQRIPMSPNRLIRPNPQHIGLDTARILLDLQNVIEMEDGEPMDIEDPNTVTATDDELENDAIQILTNNLTVHTATSSNQNLQQLEDYHRHIDQIERNLEQIRRYPSNQRVQEIFMEIDQLGNYTDVEWFQSLSKRRLYILYGHLFENWRYRSRLPLQVKARICPLGDPFLHVMPNRIDLGEISRQEMMDGCITVMENMIYTAFDIEDRKLGALHFLTALTAVSDGARETLPWLYESMYG